MVMAGLRWPDHFPLRTLNLLNTLYMQAQQHAGHYFRKLHRCEIGRIAVAGGFTGFIPLEEARLQQPTNPPLVTL